LKRLLLGRAAATGILKERIAWRSNASMIAFSAKLSWLLITASSLTKILKMQAVRVLANRSVFAKRAASGIIISQI
jgi:hypothetical protein